MFLSSLQANIFYYIINVFHNKYSNADTVVILNIKTKYTHLLDYIISYKDVNIQVKLSEDIISTCISIVYKGMSQPQFLIKKKKIIHFIHIEYVSPRNSRQNVFYVNEYTC